MEHYYTIELPRGLFKFFKKWRLKKRLNKKLKEYQARHANPRDRRERLDAWHKIHVLSVLLQKGHIHKAALAKKMQILPEFDRFLFDRACDVIYAYVNGVGCILRGGSKLPR